MPLDILKTAEVIESLENFMSKRRPSEDIRDELDLAYKIENQSLIIFEIRPRFMKESEKIESPLAKTTWVKSRQHWKIFWMRADLKWHSYKPIPTVRSIDDFLEIVDEDSYGCFWG
mgnify:CR=1 FL=1